MFARISIYRKLYEFSRRKQGWRFTADLEFWNMFDNSFSISIIFSQVQRCQEACILNKKCSRRNEKSQKDTTVTPTIMKNNENPQFSKNSKSVEHINVGFSASNDIDFWSRTIHMIEKSCPNFEKLNVLKKSKMTKFEDFRKFRNRSNT